MNKKAILIDAGGVLLNEKQMEDAFCDFSVRILQRINPLYTVEQFWKDTDEAVLTFAPRTRPYIFWKNCKNDIAKYNEISKEFQTLRKQSNLLIELMPGIIPELQKLKSRFDIVLAGQYGSNVYDLLKTHNIDELFKNKLSQDNFSITKPDPRYLAQIAKASGINPEQCIMIGDRIDNDIIPAKQMKMGSVFVKIGIYKNQRPRDPEEIPDLILDSVIGMADAIISKW